MLTGTVKDLLAAGSRAFVFDLGSLDYADSARGEMRVAAANPRLGRLFQMTGVDTLLSMYPSVAEAAAA